MCDPKEAEIILVKNSGELPPDIGSADLLRRSTMKAVQVNLTVSFNHEPAALRLSLLVPQCITAEMAENLVSIKPQRTIGGLGPAIMSFLEAAGFAKSTRTSQGTSWALKRTSRKGKFFFFDESGEPKFVK
jgi:hypothetical protein